MAKQKPIVMSGAYYIGKQFVSKAHVQAALEALGRTVLNRPPKDDNDVVLVTGKVLGKRDATAMHLKAEARGFEIVELDDLVSTRFKSQLAKSLRAADKLLGSEQKLLDELSKKKPTKAA